MFSDRQLIQIFEKANGHCHFCGDKLILKKYAWRDLNDLKGAWEIDHVIQRGKGGRKDLSNCLPACTQCNRLRWHRKGPEMRELIVLGLIAKQEIKKKSLLGKTILSLKKKRMDENKKRRRQLS